MKNNLLLQTSGTILATCFALMPIASFAETSAPGSLNTGSSCPETVSDTVQIHQVDLTVKTVNAWSKKADLEFVKTDKLFSANQNASAVLAKKLSDASTKQLAAASKVAAKKPALKTALATLKNKVALEVAYLSSNHLMTNIALAKDDATARNKVREQLYAVMLIASMPPSNSVDICKTNTSTSEMVRKLTLFQDGEFANLRFAELETYKTSVAALSKRLNLNLKEQENIFNAHVKAAVAEWNKAAAVK
ncbi:MAG: hypothetical protein WCJ29_03100 [bacterium]